MDAIHHVKQLIETECNLSPALKSALEVILIDLSQTGMSATQAMMLVFEEKLPEFSL
jgi:hypothetical protein